MNGVAVIRAGILMLCCVMALTGCQSRHVRDVEPRINARIAADGRQQAASRVERWMMLGRVAVSDGKDGGSGRLEWRQDGATFDVRLSAPVTRRSWRLVGDADWVRLEGLDGGVVEGPDAEQLLRQSVGWELPVRSLVNWMRGVPAQGAIDGDWDQEGLPRQLLQGGWAIDYRDWFHDMTPPLPRKVFAQSGEHRVRLVVERWDVID